LIAPEIPTIDPNLSGPACHWRGVAAIRRTGCTLRSGKDHAFLTVDGQVLDNRTDCVLSYSEIGCR
jgi:hypothetical protein